jgi:O-antigen/teichoic acid export membrane protein
MSLRNAAEAGGWMTVANVAASAMAYVDRVVVGALAPLTSVAYYTTPQELISKLLAIPAAITTSAFPAFAGLSAAGAPALSRVYERSTTATLVALFPPLLVLAVLAPDWLRLWVGASFAEHAVGVVRWLSVGALLAGVAASPLALLQASGRASLTAAFQLLVLPVYASMAWLLTRTYGIEGTAASWTVRMALESLLLFGAAERVAARATRHRYVLAAAALLAVLPAAVAGLGPGPRILLAGLVASAAMVVADRWLGFDVKRLVRGRRADARDR